MIKGKTGNEEVLNSRPVNCVMGCYAYDGKFWIVPKGFNFPKAAKTAQ